MSRSGRAEAAVQADEKVTCATDFMSEAADQAARAQWPVLVGAVALALERERLRSA
jgi:hypothetical protein